MELNYKQFLSLFNNKLAKEKWLEVNLNRYKTKLNKKCSILLEEEGIFNPHIKDEEINQRMQWIVDTIKSGFCKGITDITFDFKDYPMTDESMKLLTDAIKNENFPLIFHITFKNISEKALVTFADVLKSNNPLPKLFLSFNTASLSPTVLKEMAFGIGVCHSKKIYIYFMKELTKDETFSFSKELFEHDLSKKDTLSLSFSSENQNMQEFTQGFRTLTKKTSPKKWMLNFVNMDDQSAKCLGDALKEMKSPPSIDLSIEGITYLEDEGFIALTDTLPCIIENFKLRLGAIITETGIKAFIDMLKTGKCRPHFQFTCNAISDSDDYMISELADALVYCPADFNFCYFGRNIHDSSIKKLADALKKDTCPSNLNLFMYSPFITGQGMKQMMDVLKSPHCPSYFNLYIGGANTSSALEKEIRDRLRKNRIKDTAYSLSAIQSKLHQPSDFKVTADVVYNHIYPFLSPFNKRDIVSYKNCVTNLKKIPTNIAALPSRLFKIKTSEVIREEKIEKEKKYINGR